MKNIVATLGDNKNILTCSLHVAYKKYNEEVQKMPFSSFEKAIEALKDKTVDKCIVPSAYPKISNFITDLELDIKEVFLEKIPNLVLVGVDEIQAEKIETLYLHPATESIIPSFLKDSTIKKVFVSSNSDACRRLKVSPYPSLAITNELASKHYGLYTYDTLRTKMKMPFIVFSLKN